MSNIFSTHMLPTLGSAVAFLSLVALVAVTRPAVEQSMDDAGSERAAKQANEIAQALRGYVDDTGFQPTGYQGFGAYRWLRGPGALPETQAGLPGDGGRLSWFLEQDRMTGGQGWRGPYVRDLSEDPWGRSYLVWLGGPMGSARQEGASGQVWILSAGPNGKLDTPLDGTMSAGDDVAILLH